MTQQDYDDAKAQQDIIDNAAALIAKKATTGAKAVVIIMDEDGTDTLISSQTLKSALGSDYDTICTTAFTSLGTALTSAKTDAETAFGTI